MISISNRNKQLRRTVTKIVITVAVLLVLIIGGAIAFVWWNGRHQQPISTLKPAQARTTPLQRQAVAPTVDPKAPVGVSMQSITSPLVPGNNAGVDIRTKPLSECTISVVYDKTASTDSGLKPKKADEFGLLSWTWTVEANQPLGSWPVKITCKNGDKSGYFETKLELVKTLEQ